MNIGVSELITAVFLLFVVVFHFWMVIDSSRQQRHGWFIAVFLIPFGDVLYFFGPHLARRRNKKESARTQALRLLVSVLWTLLAPNALLLVWVLVAELYLAIGVPFVLLLHCIILLLFALRWYRTRNPLSMLPISIENGSRLAQTSVGALWLVFLPVDVVALIRLLFVLEGKNLPVIVFFILYSIAAVCSYQGWLPGTRVRDTLDSHTTTTSTQPPVRGDGEPAPQP